MKMQQLPAVSVDGETIPEDYVLYAAAVIEQQRRGELKDGPIFKTTESVEKRRADMVPERG